MEQPLKLTYNPGATRMDKLKAKYELELQLKDDDGLEDMLILDHFLVFSWFDPTTTTLPTRIKQGPR